jgi:spermidine/putrescine transport system substrate-binding protein
MPEPLGRRGVAARRATRPGTTMSRRDFLGRAMVVGVATPALLELLSGCRNELYTRGNLVIASPQHPVKWAFNKVPRIESGQRVKPGSTLRLYNYADYISPKVVKAFEKKFDVNVSISTFNDTDEALTKIASGAVAYDIYWPSYDQIGSMVTGDLLRPLNHDYIPNIVNVLPQYTNPWYDRGWRYSVPYTVYSTGIGWRNDLVDEDIAKRANPYDVLWDPKYHGRTAIIDDWHTAMAMVLLRNGIHEANTGKVKYLNLIRSQLLDLQKATAPKVTVTMYNDLPAGQFSVCQMWSGDAVNAQYYLPKGVKPDVLSYWFPQNGRGLVDNDLMVLLAGGKNPVAAHYFINFMLDSTNAANNFGYVGYQPPQRDINPTELVADGYIVPSLRDAAVLPQWFNVADRLLQLPPTVDALWHQIWQEYKANG